MFPAPRTEGIARLNTLQKRYEREINEIVEACHCAAERLYVTSHGGNLSWRVADDELLITPTKVSKSRIVFDDIVIAGMDGKVRFAAEGRRPTGELPMHLSLFRKREDIRTILHAHPPWMTAFALSKPELLRKPFLPEPIIEVGPVGLAEYAAPLTEDLARTFEPVVMRYNAFLMRNHGVILLCVEGMERCLQQLDMMETTAKSIAIAEMLGGANPLGKKDVELLNQTLHTRNLPMPGAPGQVENLPDLFEK